MHFKDIAQLFNISNFFVYCCLLVFSLLLSLRVDNVITWHYAIVFLPIWTWNVVLVIAVSLGIGFWIKKKNLRNDVEQKRHFVAMIISFVLHIPLFLTELLVVINTEAAGAHSWTAIFSPMYLLSVLCIGSCILSCCLKRCNIEFEFIGMVSLLQLLFVGLRLDGITSWTWAIVLIPTWITLILLVIGLVVYAVLKCCLLIVEEDQEQARLKRTLAVVLISCLSVITVCITLFLALLTARLDGLISAPFSALFVPLHIALLTLTITTITRDPANPWWFGLGKNFAEFVLDTLPVVQEYANISHRRGHDNDDDELELEEMDPGHYDNLLTVDDPTPVKVRNRIRNKQSKTMSKNTTVENNVVYVDSTLYPYENLFEPD